jgi:dTDP-6-deoxy-L-talose 4-dehydrogenase (NAD+)
MKVAVTGATGFIGGHVADRLDAQGVSYVASGRDAGKWRSGVPFLAMDASNPPSDVFERLERPDVLIHLAWGGLPNYRSLHHFETEMPRQYALLKRLVDAGLRHLVVVGTCFEYGMRDGALSEAMAPAPGNPYGLAKDVLRQQLEYLASASGVELTWARLFYMWGERQAASSLYPLLAAAVQRGDRTFDMSGGEQLRDFLPVSAVADYLVRLSLRSKGAGVVNICSGRPISVRRLVEGWIAANGWNISLNLGRYPYPDYEPMAFWGDAQKLNRCLND